MENVISEWLRCPVCGNKTRLKIRGDTEQNIFRCSVLSVDKRLYYAFMYTCRVAPQYAIRAASLRCSADYPKRCCTPAHLERWRRLFPE